MRDKIVKFYNDPDFQRLNSYYNRTTFFNIMNIERRELSHSAFLKWIFDINGSHNLNDEPLKKLLRMLANQNSNNSLYKDILNILLIGDYKIQNFHIEAEKSVKIDKKGRCLLYILTKERKRVKSPQHSYHSITNAGSQMENW